MTTRNDAIQEKNDEKYYSNKVKNRKYTISSSQIAYADKIVQVPVHPEMTHIHPRFFPSIDLTLFVAICTGSYFVCDSIVT